MTTITIRKKLMNYLADADDAKIKAIYTLLERDIQDEEGFRLTDEQLRILDKEREKHFNGQSKSYSRRKPINIRGELNS